MGDQKSTKQNIICNYFIYLFIYLSNLLQFGINPKAKQYKNILQNNNNTAGPSKFN